MMSVTLRNHPIVAALLVTFVAGMLAFGVACSSAESDDDAASAAGATTPASAVPATGTKTNDQGWPRVEGLRGKRYCEVLLARVIGSNLNAEVWNSFGLSDCPEEEWRLLDPAAIKEERQVLFAMLNGPRYWLMDAIEKKPDGERQETTFGGLRMFLGATVDLGPIPPNLGSYIERPVARETVFEFAAGAEVFELVDAAGRSYIMQSYSVQHDASLNEDTLAALGGRLKLPEGWSFRTRTLEETLRVLSDENAIAVVVQDELSNTYQLVITDETQLEGVAP
jgi:hypothetical protein